MVAIPSVRSLPAAMTKGITLFLYSHFCSSISSEGSALTTLLKISSCPYPSPITLLPSWFVSSKCHSCKTLYGVSFVSLDWDPQDEEFCVFCSFLHAQKMCGCMVWGQCVFLKCKKTKQKPFVSCATCMSNCVAVNFVLNIAFDLQSETLVFSSRCHSCANFCRDVSVTLGPWATITVCVFDFMIRVLRTLRWQV